MDQFPVSPEQVKAVFECHNRAMDLSNIRSRPVRSMTLLIASLVASAAAIAAAQTATPEWPQWRGPFNTGMARGDAPLQLGRHAPTSGGRLAIPGRGHSTPVIAGDRLFLTTAVPTGQGTPPRGPRTCRRWRRRRSRASIRGARHRSRHRKDRLAADRDDRHAARGLSPRLRQLRVQLAGHRRHARLRVLRLARPLCLRPRRHAAVAEGLRREDADGHGVRRRHAADAARRPPAAALRSPRHRLPRDARSGHRPGDLAHQAHRAVQLGRAVRGARTTAGVRSS